METLVDLLNTAAERHGDAPALSIHAGLRDRSWDYQGLRRSVGAAARYFRDDLGLPPGTPVVVWAPNSPQLVAAYFGAMMARVVLVPLDPLSTQDFLARVVEKTNAAALITGVAMTGTPPVRTVSLNEIPFDTEAPEPADAPGPGDIAEIVFTSGTTGRPKGVVLTHQNIVANVRSARLLVPQRRYEVLSILPLSHMLEQTVGLYVPLLLGSTIHYAVSRQPPVLLKAMQRYHINSLVVVPQVLELMLHGIEREVERRGRTDQWRRAHQLAPHLPIWMRRQLFRSVHRRLGSHFEFVLCGGAKLPTALEAAWERMGVRVIYGYGTTECAPIITANTYWDRMPGTVGHAVPEVAVRLTDEGEVLVRGPNVSPGYWHQPEATAAVFDKDGWYHTGDFATQDTEGRLSVKGRLSDLIVLPSGLNVHPEDVERELKAEPEIDDCVVLPLPDESGKARVHAAVIPANVAPDEATQHEQLGLAIRNAGSRLAPHQRVAGFTVWTEGDFPRTYLLKVKRHEVFDALSARAVSRLQPSGQGTPTLDRSDLLQRLLAAISGVDPAVITPASDLELDLGIDSLARVELAVSFEDELGTSLEDGDIASVATVGELSALLEQRSGAPRPPSFPTWSLDPPAGAVRSWIQHLVLFPALGLVARPFTVEGAEHLREAAPPMLLIANHNSHLDTPAILRALPRDLQRRTAVAAATDYFYATTARSLAVTLALNAFPFSREDAVRSSLEYCGDLMDRGWSILIYPEGTRSITGTMAPFRDGIGLLAAELDAPVLPIAVTGTHEALPKGRSRPQPGPVTVRIGSPIEVSPHADRPETAHRLEEAVEHLLHPAHPGGQ